MIYTIGHSNRSQAEFIGLLDEAGISLLVDVRTYPGSRHFPHFNREALPGWIGRSYRHMPALGGRRRPTAAVIAGSWWCHPSFAAYAAYAETVEFEAALSELIALSAIHATAIMCAEAVWWKCHRRIITDHLIARGVEVRHIMAPGQVDDAKLTRGAQVVDGRLQYPSTPAEAA